jgi:predicted O-methyltransferase YrrM
VSSNHQENYFFTNDWFAVARPTWDILIPQVNPSRVLEVGSYEGASTCYLIDRLSSTGELSIHCVDTWGGGIEHQSIDMEEVEKRFIANTRIAIDNAKHTVNLTTHRGYSDIELSKLISNGFCNTFDFIYVDGSHQAPDVICDAILSFKLLKVGGVIAFDDYLWAENPTPTIDPLRCPKSAIDAFTNLYCRKVKIIQAMIGQLYVQKVSN